MKDELVTIETAKLAKEKGFNWGEKCYFDINPNSQAMCYSETNPSHFLMPTQSLLQKWLREVHNIHIYIIADGRLDFGMCLNIIDSPDESGYWNYFLKTYEEALEKGLQEALKLIETKPQHLT